MNRAEDQAAAIFAEIHPSFLFAMGELSGQVRSLGTELSQMRIDRQHDTEMLLAAIGAQDKRLQALERAKWTLAGAASIVTFAGTTIISYLVYRFGHSQ